MASRLDQEAECNKSYIEVAPNTAQIIQLVRNITPVQPIANALKKCINRALQVEEVLPQENQAFFADFLKAIGVLVRDVGEDNCKDIPSKKNNFTEMLSVQQNSTLVARYFWPVHTLTLSVNVTPHTFVSSQSNINYDARPDTRQAGFCGPSIHQLKTSKRKGSGDQPDTETRQTEKTGPNGPQLGGQCGQKHQGTQSGPQDQQLTGETKDHPGYNQTPTNEAVQTTTPSPKKLFHSGKDKPERNVIIHRHP